MAIEMLNLFLCENLLQKRIAAFTDIKWKKYNAKMCIRPLLTIEDIQGYCFGMKSFRYIYFK